MRAWWKDCTMKVICCLRIQSAAMTSTAQSQRRGLVTGERSTSQSGCCHIFSRATPEEKDCRFDCLLNINRSYRKII